jgi:hypothetical protein
MKEVRSKWVAPEIASQCYVNYSKRKQIQGDQFTLQHYLHQVFQPTLRINLVVPMIATFILFVCKKKIKEENIVNPCCCELHFW